jgi:hypothetical protein
VGFLSADFRKVIRNQAVAPNRSAVDSGGGEGTNPLIPNQKFCLQAQIFRRDRAVFKTARN